MVQRGGKNFLEQKTLAVVEIRMSFNIAKKEKIFLYPLVLLDAVDKASFILTVL